MLAHFGGSSKGAGTSVERQTELTAETLWDDVSVRLREALNDQTYTTWFGEVDGASLENGLFTVAVPNDFTREWIEGHFLDLIRATVRDAGGGEERHVRFQVVEQTGEAATSAAPAQTAIRPLPLEVVAPRTEIAGINPRYTFDSFV